MNLTIGLTVKQRIIAMLVGTVLLTVTLLGGALYAMSVQLDDMNEMYLERVGPLQKIQALSDAFATKIVEPIYRKLDGNIDWDITLRMVQQGTESLEAGWSFYAAGDLHPREAEFVEKLDPVFFDAVDELWELVEIVENEDDISLEIFAATNMKDSIEPVVRGLRQLAELQMELAKETYDNAEASYQRTQIIMISVVLVILVGLIFGAIALIKGILGPLKQAEDYCEAIAGGDLYTTLPVEQQDEIGRMIDALNRMSDGLAEVVNDVIDSAASMTSGVRQIAAGNMNLSERTEEQAASLEQTAASMEQMTATVKHSADNARHANELAADATAQAEKGVEIASVAMTAMGEINDASRKISEITGVVDEIAFQTNLLALNAAVEAARAGDAGRGFAVVATEVRVLAQRSAEAAKQIKALIEDSVVKVESGSELVQQSSVALGDIVTAVKQVSVIMGEISASSMEQSEGIQQVNDAIGQMDQMTQQNAALVEQAAAAAKSLEEQAFNMERRVSYFDTGREKPQAAQPTAAAALSASGSSATAARAKPAAKPRALPTASKPSASTSSEDHWTEF
ncbi:MAG: methyl-accepting chemotaxis protein [Halieaceae bacterium]|jgi:methyl-accepting chemotaxis protein-1 (serine sensor receptor)|nr:methyl-accepting chemotaxis protein [Halieaceae bacterium]